MNVISKREKNKTFPKVGDVFILVGRIDIYYLRISDKSDGLNTFCITNNSLVIFGYEKNDIDKYCIIKGSFVED